MANSGFAVRLRHVASTVREAYYDIIANCFEGFKCEVGEEYRSVCADLPEYQDTGYCVLHFPGENKEGAFRKVLERKLARIDYDFRRTIFPQGASEFEGLEFDADADFSEVSFLGRANFQKTRFGGESTDFWGVDFGAEGADFQDAEFGAESETSFVGARFDGSADFGGAKFGSESTDFGGAKFSGEFTIYGSAKFGGESTDFSNAAFGSKRSTDFMATIFSGESTSFWGAGFGSESTDFSRARFTGAETSFINATFAVYHSTKPKIFFAETTFKEKVDFVGMKFLDREETTVFDSRARVRFDRCQIDKPEVFRFHNVVLRPSWFIDVDVRKVHFTDVKWYGLPNGPKGTLSDEIDVLREQSVDWPYGVAAPYTLLSQACRSLSANAEENREYPLANEFHYWSMDALRKQGWRSGLGLIGTLYWAFSGYGVRAGRALGVLVTIVAIFAILYMLVGHPSLRVFPIVGIWQAFADAGQAVMYSLGVMARLRPEPIPKTMGPFQILVTIEGILGPLQIALLALAIRRKVMR